MKEHKTFYVAIMRNSPRMAVTVSSVTAFIVKIQAVQLQQQGTGWGVNDGKHTAIITAVSFFIGFPAPI